MILSHELQKVVRYLLNGRESEAADLCKEILEFAPTNIEALNYYGIASCEQGYMDEAISSYRKALVLNQTYGMVKIVSEKKSGKILGVHIIGPHATDMIGEAVVGMTMGMTVEDLARAVHPHPTLSEAIMESALSLCGGAIHMP